MLWNTELSGDDPLLIRLPRYPSMEQPQTTELDRRKFDDLIVEHQEVIHRLVFRLLGWRDGVEDIVQEVFLSAWSARVRIPGSTMVEFWLKRIAINKCRSHLRRLAVHDRWSQWVRLFARKDGDEVLNDNLIQDERASRIRRAIQSLEPSYREVTVLYYLEEMTLEEIAELTRNQQNTIEVRLHRARKKLKHILSDMME